MADQSEKLGGGRVSGLLGAASAITLLKLKIFDLVHLPECLGRRIEARLETLGEALLRRRAGRSVGRGPEDDVRPEKTAQARQAASLVEIHHELAPGDLSFTESRVRRQHRQLTRSDCRDLIEAHAARLENKSHLPGR